MTTTLVILVFFQCLCTSGFCLVMSDLGVLADLTLKASEVEVNERSLTFYIYKAVGATVKQIKLVDFDTYDFILNFNMRRTVCLKPYTGSPDSCLFSLRPSKLVHHCSSYVRMSAQFISLLEVGCDPRAASSSSESSSEEMFLQGVLQAAQSIHTPGFIICEEARSCSRLLLRSAGNL